MSTWDAWRARQKSDGHAGEMREYPPTIRARCNCGIWTIVPKDAGRSCWTCHKLLRPVEERAERSA